MVSLLDYILFITFCPIFVLLFYMCVMKTKRKKDKTLQHWCSGNIDGGDKVFLKRCERNMWCLGRKISHYSWGAILITSLRLKIDNNHLTWKIVLLLASDCSNIFICFSIWKKYHNTTVWQSNLIHNISTNDGMKEFYSCKINFMIYLVSWICFIIDPQLKFIKKYSLVAVLFILREKILK